MKDTIVVLVHGQALVDGKGFTIPDQRENARVFAEGLGSLLVSDKNIAIVHGNKPQLGFVLFRAELASNILHSLPLDVCSADTQGATGYMISQEIMNVLRKMGSERRVLCTITQTLVNPSKSDSAQTLIPIGPYFDRERAQNYRETRKWEIIEEPGYGYRRAVPSLQPVDIIEMEDIKMLVESGRIVIACGGGGIPVVRKDKGELVSLEAVVVTELITSLYAQHLGARTMLMVIDDAKKYIVARLSVEKKTKLSIEELDHIREKDAIKSRSVRTHLQAASDFLHNGGKQVIITTLDTLPATIVGKVGLWIGDDNALIGG